MSAEANKAAIRRYFGEVWNKGNMGVLDEVMAPHYVRHLTGAALDREGQRQRILGFRRGFPDLHLTVEELLAEGELVSFRLTLAGTHQGPFLGVAPTGKPMRTVAIDIARFEGGKVVEQWGVTDTLAILQQLGAAPTP
jgi:predicted ester cyclase